MKRLTAGILAALLIFLSACTAKEPETTQADIPETTFEGVSIRVIDLHRTDRDRILQLQWINDTDYDVLFGEAFSIQRLENDCWVPCEPFENTGFETVGYSLKSHSYQEKRYSLAWIYDVSQPGTYRFITNCTVYNGETEEGLPQGTECTLRADFTVGEFASQTETVPGYKEPPKLTVMIGTESLEAVKGSYSWIYATGEGLWTRIEADSAHPLQMGNLLQNHETTEASAELVFEARPDSYTIRCWPDSMLRYGDVRLYEDKCQDLVTNLYTVYLEPSTTGGYIYEVTATWNEDRSPYYGTATYVFYATSYPVDPLNTEQMPRT